MTLGLVLVLVLCGAFVVALAPSQPASEECREALQRLAGRLYIPVECTE